MGCVRIRKKSDRLWDAAWRFRSQFGNAKGGGHGIAVDLIKRLILFRFPSQRNMPDFYSAI